MLLDKTQCIICPFVCFYTSWRSILRFKYFWWKCEIVLYMFMSDRMQTSNTGAKLTSDFWMQFEVEKKTGPVFSCWCCDFRVWNRGGKKKWRAAVWSVCLIYMRNKKAYQFLSLSHPFTRPASTTLLMILCIIQKQFGRLHFRRKKK